MTQMDARIAELLARLTALERERAEIVAEIDTLQSARGGKTAAATAPACANEWWRGVCEKPKVKCSTCPNQAFRAVDDVAIERHLRGVDANGVPFVMGV